MTIHSIEILHNQVSPISKYDVLPYFSQKIHEAFLSLGIRSRKLEVHEPLFFSQLLMDAPDCTFSFNGLLPNEDGQFLFDKLQIPHVSFLLDSPHRFLIMSGGKNVILSTVDRMGVDLFHSLGFQNIVFTPHGVESSLSPDPTLKREYDVVLLASHLDYEGLRSSWKTKYSPTLCRAMEEAADMCLADQEKSFYETFALVQDRPENAQIKDELPKIYLKTVLDDIENYMRGKARIELLRAIKGVKVDVFGSPDEATWKKDLGNCSNVTFHPGVSFPEALEIMKRTKILLNSCPSFKHGGHERVFYGLACGALVLSDENSYLNKQFKDGESIAFYRYQQWDKMNETIQGYLKDENKRAQVAAKGRECVMASHTWEQRAKQLIQQITPIILKMNAEKVS